MLTRVFWWLFAVEAGSVAVFTCYFFWAIATSKGGSPEGPVGAWIIVIPSLLLMIPLLVVMIGKSDRAKIAGICCLAFPLLNLLMAGVAAPIDALHTKLSEQGDFTFLWPAQRKLAHAIRAHDVAGVKRLVSGAGNLNTQYQGETLLRWALCAADRTQASVDVVRVLLDAGADPNLPAGRTKWPLTIAMNDGPAMTKLFLEKGADPNKAADGDKPLWWDALMSNTEEQTQVLRILLDHGVDLAKRDSEGGPLDWAAYLQNWTAVWLLIEHGAEWKDQHRFGKSVAEMLATDWKDKQGSGSPIPDEMRKAMKRYGIPESVN